MLKEMIETIVLKSNVHIYGDLILLMIVALVFNFIRRHKIFDFKKISIVHYPEKRDAEQNHEIYTALVELRVLVGADRVNVFRFHNGGEFLPSHPTWKLSCTHEIVRHGVTYESAKLQGLLFSRIPNIVGPIITGNTSLMGVTIRNCERCPFQPKCAKNNKRAVIIQTDEMEGSFCKFHLESQNIKTQILCGMAVGGKVFGMVGVEFCGTKILTDRADEIAQKVCEIAERIQYYLQYKKAPASVPVPFVSSK